MPNSPQTYDFVISTLTLLEAEFWASVGKILRDKGNRVAFILFDEASRRVMHKNDFPYFNIHELRRDRKDARPDVRKIYEYAQTFGIQNIRDMFIHETLAYHRTDEDRLIHKTYDYLCVLDDIFSTNKINCIIQEMGGFAAYSCVFYGARKYGVDHLFYEPACLPGRIVFNLNSFYSDIPFQLLESPVSTEARTWAKSYIDQYCGMRNRVIPVKDRHLFRDMTLGRMVNTFNAIRLVRKLHHKYIVREKAEFDELWRVFTFNVRKLMIRSDSTRVTGTRFARSPRRTTSFVPAKISSCRILIANTPSRLSGRSDSPARRTRPGSVTRRTTRFNWKRTWVSRCTSRTGCTAP